MKTMMGAESVRKGVARIFEMFQHKNLNKRLLYVVLEGVLTTMFPDNKFQTLFRNLHSKSTRVERIKEEKQAMATHEAQLRKRKGRR